MKKIKKIKIRVNGKVKTLQYRTKLSKLVKTLQSRIYLSKLIKTLKIPIKKVAIELNEEIMDKKSLNRIILKKNDKLEIVHFIGGG